MKTEDFNDLTKVSLDKLYKLRDVATDNFVDIKKEYSDAQQRIIEIQKEIFKRQTQGNNND